MFEPALPPRSSHVIALVASLGGLPVLRQILGALPKDFCAPIVVLQHLMPDRRSYMAALLASQTLLSVVDARDGDILRPGRVYVAPPGSHLRIVAGDRCRLAHGPSVQFACPSADVLLSSLAQSCGARVVAVVLTGRGADGASGSVAVRKAGGYVIAQAPISCTAVGMPEAAIAALGIDIVLPIDMIGPQILETMARHTDRQTGKAAWA